jgi:hypothetical protein
MRRAAALLACVAAAGCADLSAYGRSRWADLGDALPMSVAWGWGIEACVQVTPLVNLGLGATPVVQERIGWQDRTFRGHWREFTAAFPWSLFLTDISPIPPRPAEVRQPWWREPLPLVYRWQLRRDAPSGEGEYPGGWEPKLRQWGRHPPLSRETSGALGLPESVREMSWHDLRLEQGDPQPFITLGSPARATLWEVERDGRDLPRRWDLIEVNAFAAIVGVRVGLRPVELVDFLVGLVTFDPMGDDAVEPTATPLQETPPEPAPRLPER